MADLTATITQTDRQIMTVALARLATEWPGWDLMLSEIAEKLQAREMFEHLKRVYALDPTLSENPLYQITKPRGE